MKQTATNASGLTLAQWIRAASFAQGHGLGPSDFREARRDWEADVDPAEWGRPRSPRRHASKKKTVAEYRVWGSSPVKGETTYYRGTDRSAAEAAFDDRVYRNFEGMADDEEDVIIESAGRKIRRFGADVFRPTYFGNPRTKTAARGHATKKSPMQLQREIDEVLANPGGAWPADLAFKTATGRPLSRTPGRRSHATIGSHPLRSPEEDMLIAMLQGQLEEGEVFRNFFASGGKKRQRWLRALDTRSFDQLDELRRRAAAYGTAAGKELGSSIADILATRRSQGRGR